MATRRLALINALATTKQLQVTCTDLLTWHPQSSAPRRTLPTRTHLAESFPQLDCLGCVMSGHQQTGPSSSRTHQRELICMLTLMHDMSLAPVGGRLSILKGRTTTKCLHVGCCICILRNACTVPGIIPTFLIAIHYFPSAYRI